jgi:hypothetical protein
MLKVCFSRATLQCTFDNARRMSAIIADVVLAMARLIASAMDLGFFSFDGSANE